MMLNTNFISKNRPFCSHPLIQNYPEKLDIQCIIDNKVLKHQSYALKALDVKIQQTNLRSGKYSGR